MNKQSYTVAINNAKSFILGIANFSTATGLFITIKKLFIRLNMTMSLLMNFTITIKSKINLVVTSSALLKSNTTINIKGPRLNNIGSALYNLNIVDDILVHLVAVSSALLTANSTITHLFIRLNMTPTLSQFFTLGNFDPDTLGSLDSSTLGSMIST